MKEIIRLIEGLKKDPKIRGQVDSKMGQFKKYRKMPADEIFKQLCFCIMTANFNAKRSMEIEERIGDGFICFPEKKLASKLKEYGHRFPNARANYMTCNRKHKETLKQMIDTKNEKELRDWIVKNIKGLGYKEASHFLRNIGYENFAIIDFHIIDVLVGYGLIERPKAMTRNKYLEIEKILGKIAKRTGLSQGELDFYLWYSETQKILK
ncbi:MAG: N-glycosylase/DNA lyase [Candidatus Aenigmarchaeota archaeon]|nr:N-glycosylase/DNA lyase [Candidatus Aenigmarchaeota archaeon]